MNQKLNPGDPAPKFSLPDSQGNQVKLKDLKGKNVVLYFYPKDATPGCTQEACDFRDSFLTLKAKNAILLGISKDSVDSHQRFKTKHELPFELLSDPEGEVCELYGVWQEKKNYGRSYMGIVRSTFVIDTKGKIKEAIYNVRVAGHVPKVLEIIE